MPKTPASPAERRPDEAADASPDDGAKPTGTAAFSKFMAVLQLVADADTPQSIAQLARASGYPRPTVYRIVGALVTEGLLIEHPVTGTLELGARLVNLASRYWGRSDLRVAAADPLRALRDATRETVHLAVPSDTGMVYIEKLESPQAVRMASRIGTRVTLYSSSVGKAFISRLPAAERNTLLSKIKLQRWTDHTVTDRAVLDREIAEVAVRGYAEDREENELQIFCFGAPIVGPDGRPFAAVSVSVPMFRMSDAPLDAYVAPLLAACRAIGERVLGNPDDTL
ncbi:IclR family transcriptional regulator [Burkholderia sp. Ac-20379]|uniref:IclR family transcriptional regulator n=1 Tax=Burkholderia sp. Ac-20379 TaxID=2703900 RepID=UPI0019812A24|nr:IclR family transcriptional regulator [Burkholderia sp. Ac-20379]MBN3722997.1 IclR family transcriptional regulator [Burkholderia sp. Ac-20379]